MLIFTPLLFGLFGIALVKKNTERSVATLIKQQRPTDIIGCAPAADDVFYAARMGIE